MAEPREDPSAPVAIHGSRATAAPAGMASLPADPLVADLAQLAREVGTAADLIGIYRALRDFAHRTGPTSGLFVGLLDEAGTGRVCVFASSEGQDVDVSDLPLLPLSDSPASRAITTGEVILTDDLDAALEGKPTKLVGTGPLSQSSVSVPLKVLGTVIGAFDAQAEQPGAYQERHIVALQMAADLAAIATQNLRLREQEIAARHSLEASRDEYRELSATLERRVAERTEWLTQANEQLESFSYSVSHDLRSPLHTIDGFSSLLAEEKAGQLDEEGLGFLARIRNGVKRMERVLEALLAFSRVTGTIPRVLRVDLDGLVGEEIAEIRAQLGQRIVTFEIQPLGVVLCDPDLMRQVWRNLLDNAVKYTARRPDARVEIGCEVAENATVYFVRDNGAGFASSDADRLFTPFKRLHSESEFPGTGIGLATAARIIGRHHGRIWAEAEPDRGATFRFTIGELTPSV